MKITIFFIGIILFAISCENQKDVPQQLDIPYLIDNKIDLNLSDVFSEVSYIPLESSKATYISQVNQLIVDGDFILVFDRNYQKLLQFNEEGNFVGEFMKKGKGPGDFFEITSIDVNENKEILILRNGQFLDIMKYDGTVINSIKFNKTPNKARWVAPQIIALFYPYPNYLYNDGYEISFVNREGKVLKNALKHKMYDKEKRGLGARVRIGKNDGSLYYWSHQCDTVYTISKSLEVYPRYVFKHDDRHIPVESLRKPNFVPTSDNQYTVESYDEWGDYLFIFVVYGRHGIQGVINKKLSLDGDVISDYNKWTFLGLLNDIDGGMTFWPGSTQLDGSVVKSLDPQRLLETFKHNQSISLPCDEKKQKELKNTVIDHLNIMSNPVLMRVR